jgi:hypothetical protein
VEGVEIMAYITENEVREDERRVSKVLDAFASEKQLRSLIETVNLCQGFDESGERCGDEVDAGVELCATHQREDDLLWQRRLAEADGYSELVSYPHLTD